MKLDIKRLSLVSAMSRCDDVNAEIDPDELDALLLIAQKALELVHIDPEQDGLCRYIIDPPDFFEALKRSVKKGGL